MLLQLLVMLIEFAEFIRQNVSVWHEIKVLLAIPFLHSDHIEAKSIFPCNLMTLREMVDFLVLIKAFIEVTLAAA